MKCRHCASDLSLTMLDLGSAPPSNAYLTPAALARPEKWFPLRVLVCEHCWLVQTGEFSDAGELFDAEYAYFSAFSTSWLAHCERYVEAVTASAGLGPDSLVVEVASNDGYLLQYFAARGIPSLGVEPTTSTAAAARAKGLRVVESFFGVATARELAAQGLRADLMAANNVLAHVPDINDFVAGFAVLLKDDGLATFEFPHLLRLVEGNQYDTIYHEHYSYLSLCAVERIFASQGLAVFDVEEHPTHGGSLRVFAQRAHTGRRPVDGRVRRLLDEELRAGVESAPFYARAQPAMERIRDDLLLFLIDAKRRGRSVGAYGAAAKGNTLLNFAGVRPDLLPWVVDRNPAKQGKCMPGSRIPIVDEAFLRAQRPDFILVLPWNLREEITAQLSYARAWNAAFVTSMPALRIDAGDAADADR